ncbi:protein lin-52 homolog isoform X1 [Schistocerca cancellata]|uniref:protein lin-52 homolog isoform X1 n=1 Tax=Schistocerca cancellata TaxID=274614 RepID=UPI002119AD19|nr:protein lin-52 homolog isoform X1 [Schistocerca cancellata]
MRKWRMLQMGEFIKVGTKVSNMSELDENLLSMENLDRASPELWPEKIPGMSNFVNQTAAANTSGQPWNKELDSEDINLLHQFGSLTAASLIGEVKKLHDIAYELGLQEAKEMTRGKYLNILSRSQH